MRVCFDVCSLMFAHVCSLMFADVVYSLMRVSSGARCPLIYVPDTIIIRHGRPVHWIFTSAKTGEVRERPWEVRIYSIAKGFIARGYLRYLSGII